MKTQTAIDWLNSEFERLSNQIGVNLSWSIVDDLIKQAKEKEKDQIENAYIQGFCECDNIGVMDTEKYYKNTFK